MPTASTYHLLNSNSTSEWSAIVKARNALRPGWLAAWLKQLDIPANTLQCFSMFPKNNRKVTAEEMLEQCRRNRQEARILEKRDRPYEIEPLRSGLRISAAVLTRAKSKAS